MRKFVFHFPLFFILVACSLSAKQEANLNLAVSKYVQARNECYVVSLVAYTYPELVHYYKNQGDSLFKHEFDCSLNEKYMEDIFDPTMNRVKSDGKLIQVEYNFKKGNTYENKGELKLFAISEDDGSTWYFLDKEQYWDKIKCKNLKRLFN